MQDYVLHVLSIYDEWLYNTEKRGASYGEIAYIQNLNKKELKELEKEILKELEKMEGANNGSN